MREKEIMGYWDDGKLGTPHLTHYFCIPPLQRYNLGAVYV